MAFHEIRLPLYWSEVDDSGPTYANLRTIVRSGAETSVALWEFPLRDWTLSARPLNKDRFDELVAFYHARGGDFHGFRWQDPRDYLVGRSEAAVETPVATSTLTSTTFQIVRPYTSGGITKSQPVYKPNGDTLTNTVATQADSTVRVYQADGTTEVTSGWTVNLTTGVITFSGAPGYVPKCSCEFDWPVRFDIGRLPDSYTQFMRALNGVKLIELRQF